MKVFGQLRFAQLHNLAADPTPGRAGLVYYRYDTDLVNYDSGTTIRQILDSRHAATASGTHGVTGTIVGTSDTQSLSNKLFLTSNAWADPTDTTKKIAWNLASLTTGVTLTLASNQSTAQTLAIPNVGATDSFVTNKAAAVLTNKSLTAGSTSFVDATDNTKLFKFDLSGMVTGSNFTIAAPIGATGLIYSIPSSAANQTFAMVALAQNLTNKNLVSGGNDCYFADATDLTKKMGVSLSGATTGTATTLLFAQTAARAITFPDATDTLAGIAATQTLTNKTLTGAKISNYLELAQIASPASATTSTNRFYFKTDGKPYSMSSAGVETAIGAGSGSGSKNYVSNGTFESGVSGWTLNHSTLDSNKLPNQGTGSFTSAAGTLSFSQYTASPLTGLASAQLVSTGATTAGDFVYAGPFILDASDQGRVLSFSFNYKVLSGAANCNFSGTSSNSFAIAIHDYSNGMWLQPAGSWSMIQSSGVGVARGTIQLPSNSNSFLIAIYCMNATAGAVTLLLDDIVVGPQATMMAPAMSDWQPYTMTIKGATTDPTKGTVSIDKAYWRRVGDTMEIRYSYYQTAGGTAGSGVYRFQLPTGYTIDSTKCSLVANQDQASNVGSFEGYNGHSVTGNVFAYDSTSIAAVAGANTEVQTAVGSGYCPMSASCTYQFTARVPITGWSANTASSADTDTRVVAASYNTLSSTSVSAGGAFSFTTTAYDTHAAKSGTNYVVPVTGFYRVTLGGIYLASGSTDTSLRLNGSVAAYLGAILSTGRCSLTGTVKANAGDLISVVSQSAITTGDTIGYLYVERLSGPAVVQATESVNLRYSGSATGTIATTFASSTTLNWPTKDFDSHGIYSSGSITIPVSGKYSIKGQVQFNGTFALNNFAGISMFKNGVQTSDHLQQSAGSLTTIYVSLEDTYSFVAGDVVTFRAASAGSSVTIAGGVLPNRICIERVGN